MAESSVWHYARQGQKQAPVETSALQKLIAQGLVLPTDLVWRAGMANWMPAGSVPELLPPGSPLQYYAPPPQAPGDDIGQNAGIRMLIPVGRSVWAIIAGYLGLFSFVIFPAPIALVISIIAILDIRRDKTKHGMGRAIFGLVMGILGTVVLGFIGVAFLMRK